MIIDDPRAAATALLDGALVVLPTETVYGLAGRADDADAIARIYAVKGRPSQHPVIVHVADADAALDTTGPNAWVSSVPDYARDLASGVWPGPLTLVLARSPRAGDDITGGQDTVALRVPAHPIARSVIGAMDDLDPAGAPHGVAAPSANVFGHVSPTTLAHALDDLSARLTADDVAMDGGPCTIGVESTIVDCTGPQPRVLRPGGISTAQIELITGLATLEPGTSGIRVPGALPTHYAPAATVTLVHDEASLLADIEAAIADGHDPQCIGVIGRVGVTAPAGVERLLVVANDEDYARGLYDALRRADTLGITLIVAILPGPDAHGIAEAIADRLHRAAT